MPTLPQLVPPADLLNQVGGIEQGLQRGRRVRWVGVVVAAVQAAILVANSDWFKALASFDWKKVDDQLYLLIPLFLLCLSVALVG